MTKGKSVYTSYNSQYKWHKSTNHKKQDCQNQETGSNNMLCTKTDKTIYLKNSQTESQRIETNISWKAMWEGGKP